MRPELLAVASHTPDDIAAILMLVCKDTVPVEVIGQWSPLEQAVVIDWAMREHLAASDNLCHRRPKPWIIEASAVARNDEVAATVNRTVARSVVCKLLGQALPSTDRRVDMVAGVLRDELPRCRLVCPLCERALARDG